MTAEREIERILRKIVEGYRPLKIILFGSYAYGTPDESSDIDMLIIKETRARLIDRFVEVKRLVADPNRRIPFEPIVLTPGELERRLAIGDQFIQEIMTRGKVLYAA
jgi:predicted nucleotidyltransferase